MVKVTHPVRGEPGSSQGQWPGLYPLPELPLLPRLITHPLLMVGDDTADEAGVGVAECGHEAAQGLLVELSHCSEHAPPGAAPWWAIPKAAHLLQPHDALHYGKRK